ncbi:hypothetical protein CQW23_18485 [Capsicum baccatum]|uniref:HECT-type E3 ubiquitin transferase n=1 Tax=Capsicum baccatum TaxID=33114 RepID=A0A2G2W332_CAPBA|nr:hypothetical protein CQW23_18485 [Capsicum baccatum]
MQLCEMLSIGTEDSLSTFSMYSFVPVLLGLLNHKNNPDIMLLAARALTHLVNILPSSCVAILHYGVVSCFVAHLITIEYMDLDEQSLQALKKISQEHPSACLRAGTLMAVLSYLNFFSSRVQRVAIATAAHMCKKLCSMRLIWRMPENVNPRLRTSCFPRCKEKYDLDLAKLVFEFENLSSQAKLESPRHQLPQWLQNDMLKNDSNVTSLSQIKDQGLLQQKNQELRKKWKDTCLQLQPTSDNV